MDPSGDGYVTTLLFPPRLFLQQNIERIISCCNSPELILLLQDELLKLSEPLHFHLLPLHIYNTMMPVWPIAICTYPDEEIHVCHPPGGGPRLKTEGN